METMQTSYFETQFSFNELQIGVEKYKVPKSNFSIIELPSGLVVIATKSQLLIDRFTINPKFKKIELTKDELSFRMADQPLRRSTGNPNLLPLI